MFPTHWYVSISANLSECLPGNSSIIKTTIRDSRWSIGGKAFLWCCKCFAFITGNSILPFLFHIIFHTSLCMDFALHFPSRLREGCILWVNKLTIARVASIFFFDAFRFSVASPKRLMWRMDVKFGFYAFWQKNKLNL